jgi:tRNA nucleotidyltransferase (CCA-adding enzyme)
MISKSGQFIINKLNKNGYLAYFVGGCVRDTLLGITPKDIDITTSATPSQIKEVFSSCVDTGIRYGTVTVIIENDKIEVTTFRIDGKYISNRKPDKVSYSRSIIDDLKRRDFTINAIALSSKGEYIDPFLGILDLKKGRLRCVGDPNLRFREDALRILRAIKFASRLNLKIEINTKRAMQANCFLLKNISNERIIEELRQSFRTSSKIAYKLVKEIKLFDNILNGAFRDNFKNIKVEKCNNILEVFSIALKNEPETFSNIKRLKMTNYEIAELKSLYTIKGQINFSKVAIKKMLSQFGHQKLINLLEYKARVFGFDKDKIIKIIDEIIKNKECFSLKDLAINGKDLTHIPPNKRGEYLKNALEIVIKNNNKNNKGALLK